MLYNVINNNIDILYRLIDSVTNISFVLRSEGNSTLTRVIESSRHRKLASSKARVIESSRHRNFASSRNDETFAK